MEYARKSLMQHATASPQTAIRKINKVAAESNGKPTITDLLLASDAEDNMDSRPPPQRPTGDSTQRSFAKSDTPFTFESSFLPAFNSTAAIATTTVIPEGSNTFTGSAFNFSPPSTTQRADSFSSIRGGSRDETAKAGHDSGGEASMTPSQLHAGNAGHRPLDLRTEPLEGFSQIHHEFAHPESTSKLRASIARRAVPYKVPTVNERETFRSSRMSGFRARPLDPKVFTSAGDLGVPRIRKLPLTVPVSPEFSKPRVKDPKKRTEPVKTPTATRLENTIKAKLVKLPAITAYALLSVPRVDQVRPQPGDTVVANINYQTNQHPAPTETATSIYPANPASRAVQESRFKVLLGKPIKTVVQKSIRGAPMRQEDPNSASTTEQSSDEQSAPSATLDRLGDAFLRLPLTKPQPYKFATDELLRRRRAMFQPRGTSTWVTAAEGTRTTAKTSVTKRPQPPLKRLTVPVPFQLATQQRAEIYAHVHQSHSGGDSGAQLPSSSKGSRRLSRLAGLAPLRSIIPHGTTFTSVTKPRFKPTVPISPKFGQRVPVRALQPARFLLKKSTKELTQPHEFHFHSDQRAKERELLEQSVKRREQELEEARQRTTRLHLERDHGRRVRESMERTFRAQPIKHYPPITVRKATKPLTNPVSPMIGEKRKRHAMEMQNITQQKQQQDLPEQLLRHESQFEEPPAGNQNGVFTTDLNPAVEQDVYREFEEAKILQEQHRTLQEQLTRQERRQLELANSSRATIHQPPIRLSFPMNPEMEALQADDAVLEISRSGGILSTPEDNLQPNFTPALPTIRDSFEGSENHRLSKELRRVSLNGRRTSGGHRRRTGDIGNQSRGTGSGRLSLEGRRSDTDDNTGGYYPFTRSQVPTNIAVNQSIATQESAASLLPTGARSAVTSMAAESAAGEDRRRSGSFIPLDMDEPLRKSLSRSKGLVVIDHTLTLNDL
ncbi:hypothetical protein BGZ58_010826 [Dissophora ornata]|nr:hypothetical protein BGZ58_010826 [Dissophora ornata]